MKSLVDFVSRPTMHNDIHLSKAIFFTPWGRHLQLKLKGIRKHMMKLVWTGYYLNLRSTWQVHDMTSSWHHLCTVSFWKYAPPPPLFAHYFEAKVGRGVCSNIQLVSCIRPSLCSSQSLIHVRVTITMTAVAFWKNSSFAECILWEISSARVDTKLRDIEIACIISGDRGRPRVSSCSQCEQQKPWWWPANKTTVILGISLFRKRAPMGGAFYKPAKEGDGCSFKCFRI